MVLMVSSTLAKKMRPQIPYKVLRSKRIQKYLVAILHVACLLSAFPVSMCI